MRVLNTQEHSYTLSIFVVVVWRLWGWGRQEIHTEFCL